MTELKEGFEDITFDFILGHSKQIQQTVELARKAAMSDATVLITGESGTGKELFARAIHSAGLRKDQPFVAINCAAIPETLMESELFGYEDGAFTGAKRGGKIGKIEAANNGTLFLDEIGDMPLYMQVKLLRVLQEKKFERVGGVKTISVDVRVVAATNRNLPKMVEDGSFREDMYYRLNVIPCYIPALRERFEDVGFLVQSFLEKYCRRHNKTITSLADGLLDHLRFYKWPGNVRELENVIEFGVCFETGPVLQKETILPKLERDMVQETPGSIEPLDKALRKIEKNLIRHALEMFADHPNPVDKAAEALQISRATLYRKLKKH